MQRAGRGGEWMSSMRRVGRLGGIKSLIMLCDEMMLCAAFVEDVDVHIDLWLWIRILYTNVA
jgi:hypothetical protein